LKMVDLRGGVLTAAAVFLGGILYLSLNWIPVLGPLAVGFIVGYAIKQNPGRGFRAGVYSAALGVLMLALLLAETGLINPAETGTLWLLLTSWILFIWNLAGILLAGLGGMLGSLARQTKRMMDALGTGMAAMPFNISFGAPAPKRVLRLRAPPMEATEKPEEAAGEERVVFVICPHCGSSNLESNKKCGNCGRKLG